MANAFKNGDVVVLKSGGPPMTVDAVPGKHSDHSHENEYRCRWFKGATAERGHFAEHLLKEYAPPAIK